MSDQPKRHALLNGSQLVEFNKKIEDCPRLLVSRGSKSTTKDDVDEVEAYKTRQYEESMKNLLSLERVTMSNKISKGVFEQEQNRVKVTFHFGKWNAGFYEDNCNYLKPHEALHLMEMKRLEVTFGSVIMSIEQAYAIFLNPDNEISFEEYLTYSYLIRAGYVIDQHNTDNDTEKYEVTVKKQLDDKEDEMIWCVLMEKLDLPVDSKLIESGLYEKAKKTMASLCEQISGKRESQESKRRCSESDVDEPASKRAKPNENDSQERNFLDILKTEAEHSNYQEICRKFSFVKRTETFDAPQKTLKITFDVFMPTNNFKRSEDLASYRVVVLRSTENFPTNVELELLRRQQRYQRPIVLAIVSESMTLHFSICTF